MPSAARALPTFKISLPFASLTIFLCILWFAGGASRADALGQVVVRAAAALAMIVAILFGPRPVLGPKLPILLFMCAALLISILELIPLPPVLWQMLPGRAMFLEAAVASGQAQPWRPLAVVPAAAENAAAALIVPAATLLLMFQIGEHEGRRLPSVLLFLIGSSAILGLLQFSGAGYNNPLINDQNGQVSGNFANRNHFALFAAFGCLIAPAWSFMGQGETSWRPLVAGSLMLLLVFAILATGSRVGLVLGVFALILGLLLVSRSIHSALSAYPRWVFPVVLIAMAGILVTAVLISFAADRAVAINRVIALDSKQDLRVLALPTVWSMIVTYFPVGSGLGGFDPIYRIHEQFNLLQLDYYNHAHNDFLEIALDAGLVGITLLLAVATWWVVASFRAWRAGTNLVYVTPKIGSAMLLLVMLASVFDYPARTPMMMATIVIASVWLCGHVKAGGSRSRVG